MSNVNNCNTAVYSYTDSNEPCMPKLGKGLEKIKFISSKLSKDMEQAIIPIMFPVLSAHMTNVRFQYADNSWKLLCGMMCHLVGPQGVGKGQMDKFIDAAAADFRAHDDEELRQLAEWKRKHPKNDNSKSPTKEEEPELCFRFPDSDASYAGFIKNAMHCEERGNLVQYFMLPEIEMADSMCGGHKKVSMTIRNIYDSQRQGALRATTDGVTGKPTLRVCMNFASTAYAARNFYKKELFNGTLGRIVFSYKGRKERSGKIPRLGTYDNSYNEQMGHIIEQLSSITGDFKVPQLNKIADKLAAEMAKIADLTDNDTMWDMSKRSIVNAWKCGCIMWLLNDQTFTRGIGDMVEWMVYHDLWSKIQVFGDMLGEEDTSTTNAAKCGPKNMLDSLPNAFNEAQLEALRIQLGKESNAKHQLQVWMNRGFIEFSAVTGLYSKTQKYLTR